MGSGGVSDVGHTEYVLLCHHYNFHLVKCDEKEMINRIITIK